MRFNSPTLTSMPLFLQHLLPQVGWEGVSPHAICAARMPWYFHPPPTTSHLQPYIFLQKNPLKEHKTV